MKVADIVIIFAIACSLVGSALGFGKDSGCAENEEPSSCFNGCEPTCKNPDIACLAVCGGGGCTCKSGYLRDSNGKCVPSDKC